MAILAPVIVELERLGARFEYLPETANGESWVRTLCPFHVDTNPSCDINCDSKNFHCQSCGKSGDLISFIARKLNIDRAVVIADLVKRYGAAEDRVVDVDVVESYHQNIWKAKPLLKELYKRAITDDIIREFRLGEVANRITIPIKNAKGEYVDIIKYSPGAPTRKFIHLSGRGKLNRLYPLEQMRYTKLCICGGPVKALAATTQLNPLHIGCVSSTQGETNWDTSLNSNFRSKEELYVLLDVDNAGQKAAEIRCAMLSPFANTVYKVDLSAVLDIKEYPKGDSTDFQAAGGNLAAELEKAKSLGPWKPRATLANSKIDYADPVQLELAAALAASNSRKRVKVKVMVSALDQDTYHLPKDVRVLCDRQQDQCGVCPILALGNSNTETVVNLPAESDAILMMMNEPTFRQSENLQEALRIPKCPVVKFEPVNHYHVEEVRVCPELSIGSETNTTDSILAPMVCVSPDNSHIELNETYYMTGQFVPHPKTQTATLLISETEPAIDALSSFQLDNPEELEVFRPASWELDKLTAKLTDIVSDLETNVTRIYGRPELHIAVGLTFHSCLFVPHGSNRVKGWVETLVVSDSAQGKSTAVNYFMQHYGLGEKVECKNATVAGLVGGLQQFNSAGKWYAKWGVMPTHDRRLVVLEELKGMHRDVFSKLTEMRSSGVADIPKIERRKAHARTRLIALSNSRSGQAMAAYNYGTDTIKELIPNLEDVRRFDVCILLNSEDIDSAVLNSKSIPTTVLPKYSTELSRQLVLWAWTRKLNQVLITADSEKLLATEAQRLCEKYTDAIPILDRGSTRHKLARLSTALSCWTFSTSDDYSCVVVRPCHVQFVSEFLDNHYSSKSHGYARYSEHIKLRGDMRNSEEVLKQIIAAPHARDLAEHMLHTADIETQDICDWVGWDHLEVQPLVSTFMRNQAFIRIGRYYKKTAGFVNLLQKSLANGVLKVPEHVGAVVEDPLDANVRNQQPVGPEDKF